MFPISVPAGRIGWSFALLEFLKDQYRHCKPILVMGDASGLFGEAGIPVVLPSGDPRSRIASIPGRRGGHGTAGFYRSARNAPSLRAGDRSAGVV